MSDFFELIEQTKTASPKDRRNALLPEADNTNISRLILRLQGRCDQRMYLRALCDLCSTEKVNAIVTRNLQIHKDIFRGLFRSEDAKVRKLVCELTGNTAPDLFLEELSSALERETTDFVRPSILLALGNVQNEREIARNILENYTIPPCEEKHAEEQRLALKKAKSSLMERPEVKIAPLPPHTKLILDCPSTNITSREVKALGYDVQASPFPKNTLTVDGVERYRRIFAARSYYHAYILYGRYRSYEGAVDALRSGGFAQTAHALFGEQKLPYRIELKCEKGYEPQEGRRKAAEKIASMIDDAENGLIMSPSAYIFEAVIFITAKGILVTILPSSELDDRFIYKKEGVPASIHPAAAAACISFIKENTYPDANVLDCFCGSGTMLFERARLPYVTLTGSDISPAAIRIARGNEKIAKTGAVFFAKNATHPFREKYDEVICNLPFGLRVGSHAENRSLYRLFLKNLSEMLTDRGKGFLFTHEKRLLEDLLLDSDLELIAKHSFSCGGLFPAMFILKKKA